MMAFPGMLVGAAKKAGMKVPADPDQDYDRNEFAHFHVFCEVQLGRPIRVWGEHWGNAKVIAAIPESEIRTTTLNQILARGLSYSQ